MYFYRCEQWKIKLGFTGNHPFSKLTPEQCHTRLIVCSLHFSTKSFTNSLHNRLLNRAIPTLLVSGQSAAIDANLLPNISSEQRAHNNMCDLGIQTNIVFYEDQSTQTQITTKLGNEQLFI